MWKKHYVILTPFFPSATTFAGPFILDQAVAIQKTGLYDVIVIRLSAYGPDKSYTYEGIVVHHLCILDLPSFLLPGVFNRYNVKKVILKLKQLTNNKLESIRYVHGHVGYPSGVLAVSIAQKAGGMSIVQHHGLDVMGYTNGRLHKGLLRRMHNNWIRRRHLPWLNKAGWNVGVSQKTLRALHNVKGYCNKNEYVLYNGVDFQKFYPIPGLRDPERFTIGCIANFWPIKDQITLIKAVAKVVADPAYHNLILKFVGSGATLQSCQEYVSGHHLERHIIFLPTAQHIALCRFYNTLDLFVLPSYYEAFGCVYTEAYCCGVPFIAVSGQGISEIIAPENRSLQLISKSDVTQLAELIKYYYQHRDILPELLIDCDINHLVADFFSVIKAGEQSKEDAE